MAILFRDKSHDFFKVFAMAVATDPARDMVP